MGAFANGELLFLYMLELEVHLSHHIFDRRSLYRRNSNVACRRAEKTSQVFNSLSVHNSWHPLHIQVL